MPITGIMPIIIPRLIKIWNEIMDAKPMQQILKN
jgi:hypothetical protein